MTNSPISPLEPDATQLKSADAPVQMVPTYQPTRGGSLDQLTDSVSPTSVLYVPRGTDYLDETETGYQSSSCSPPFTLQKNHHAMLSQAGYANRHVDSSSTGPLDRPAPQMQKVPRSQRVPSDRRLRPAASSPSLTTHYHQESGLNEMPQDLRRPPRSGTIPSREKKSAPSSSPAPDKPLPQTPAQIDSTASSRSQYHGPYGGTNDLESPFALRTQHDGWSRSEASGRLPRTEREEEGAASRTQDIIEILDTVLWLAKTHNGACLRRIAQYTSNFRAPPQYE